MRYMAAIILLMFPATTQSEDFTLSYGGHDPRDSMVIREMIQDGWREYLLVIGVNKALPPISETTFEAARIGISYQNYKVAAETRYVLNEYYGYIIIFPNSEFRSMTRADRCHVFAHELLHALYRLPDHHNGYKSGTNPKCVMDNFFRNGWSRQLCRNCKSKVSG